MAMRGSTLCFVHDPANIEKRLEASRKGGLAKSKDTHLLPPVNFQNPQAISGLLGETINRIRYVDKDGRMDVRTASTIATLIGRMIDHSAQMKGASSSENNAALIEISNYMKSLVELNDD